ncbi:MAG: hypothetical protein CL608_19560 [Anaerolineaceae bacterium]|nr:hypothetical protein [Anaerolineaceae bacterium]
MGEERPFCNPSPQRYTFPMTNAPTPTNAILTTSLDRLGVHFLAGQPDTHHEIAESPVALLRGLASSDEARLRLALIPLFLKRPEYALHVENALIGLSPTAQHFLRCYYTAAQLLQQKQHQTLTELFGNLAILPSLFEDSLNLVSAESPDVRLQRLAREQARLIGRPLNWYGTYEHAYNRLVQHSRRRLQWHR